MNCVTHPETPAVAFCRSCGKALCQICRRVGPDGIIYCEEHLPAAARPQDVAQPGFNPMPPPSSRPPLTADSLYSPYTAPVGPPSQSNASPSLAFILGFIPGVGAIYNGQYAKGLLHVVVVGTLIAILSSGIPGSMEPLVGCLLGAWFFYMAFEAYHTAKRRQLGLPVDEFSSIVPLRGGSRFPVAPILLMGFGFLFLLSNFDLVRFRDIIRFWPVALIAIGAYMLYERLSGTALPPSGIPEATDERR